MKQLLSELLERRSGFLLSIAYIAWQSSTWHSMAIYLLKIEWDSQGCYLGYHIHLFTFF